MKKIAVFLMLTLSSFIFAAPAVIEQEEVRIYSPIEFFEINAAGNKGTSLGLPEIMEGGIKAKVLEVRNSEEYEHKTGNWCKIRLRLGMWMENTPWIEKNTEIWCFIPEDALIFRY